MPAPSSLPANHSARHLAVASSPPSPPALPTPDRLDEQVAVESQALVLTSIRRAADMLENGTPDVQLKVIAMFAKPAIDKAMASGDEASNVMTHFHAVRHEMVQGGRQDAVDAELMDAVILDDDAPATG